MALTEANIKLADDIRATLSADGKTGLLTQTEGSFENLLPEGLTIEHVTSVDTHRSNYAAAGARAVGMLGAETLRDHPSLSEVKGTLSLGGTTNINLVVNRSTEHNNMAKPGEKITKYGSMTVDYEFSGAKNSGQLKAARREVQDIATAYLSNAK